jgi:hypothetical protein
VRVKPHAAKRFASAAARLLRADLAIEQDRLAVFERDERHAAVEQVVIEYHCSPPLHVEAVFCLSWPSSWIDVASKPGSVVRSNVPSVSDPEHCVDRN